MVERTSLGCTGILVSGVLLLVCVGLLAVIEGSLWLVIPALMIWIAVLGYIGRRGYTA